MVVCIAYFSLRIFTVAICSSVMFGTCGARTVRHTTYDIRHTTYDIRHTTYDIRHTTYDIRHTTYDIRHTTYDIRHTTYHTTPIPSQRARASSVGKTPSFSFCQVDVLGYVLVNGDATRCPHYLDLQLPACRRTS